MSILEEYIRAVEACEDQTDLADNLAEWSRQELIELIFVLDTYRKDNAD